MVVGLGRGLWVGYLEGFKTPPLEGTEGTADFITQGLAISTSSLGPLSKSVNTLYVRWFHLIGFVSTDTRCVRDWSAMLKVVLPLSFRT